MGSPAVPARVAARVVHPTWAGSLGLLVITAGWVIGTRTLGDNSFLTHLATGRIILDTNAVPDHDPYTFTAAGDPWVVQSWLVSFLYAAGEQVGGLWTVQIISGTLAALVAGLAWTLLRPATSVVLRAAAAALFLASSAEIWSARPFMVGLIALALVALAGEGRLDPRWLVPVGWVWVNSHGSFPLGVVYLLAVAVGHRLDGGSWRTELRALGWVALGMSLGAIGPLGPKVLWFPIELLQRQDVLANVVEWQAPAFDTPGQRLFIVEVALVILLLVRRPSYRSAIPVVIFTGLALLSARNLVVASLVFLPAIAPALEGFGNLVTTDRSRAARLLAATATVALLVVTVGRARGDHVDLRAYPVGSLAYLESAGVDTRATRLAAPDLVGNLVDYVYGPERRTFYDDRFDLFSDELAATNQALIVGSANLRDDLDDWRIDLVILKTSAASAQVLTTDPTWRPLHLEDHWVLLCRRGASLGATRRC